MTEQELQGYAQHLIEDHATDIEWLTIHEMAEDYFEGEELSGDDAERVQAFINSARITITWGD